ncbi:dihydrodipicolinate reductase C-terminal domain-containing protein [Saccharopolyspora sp. NPDC000995]
MVAAGNYSVMAAVLQRAAAMAAKHLGQWEIIDFASATKPDVPSGTARELAEILGEVRRPDSAVPLSDLHGPDEAHGTEVAGTRIHSVRLPGFVVTTESVFGKAGEKLTMRHDPGTTPAPYAEGTLLAIRKVAEPQVCAEAGLPAVRALNRGVSLPRDSRADRRVPAVGPQNSPSAIG